MAEHSDYDAGRQMGRYSGLVAAYVIASNVLVELPLGPGYEAAQEVCRRINAAVDEVRQELDAAARAWDDGV